MPWPELTLESWEQFSGLVGRLEIGVPPGTVYSFRGQPDASETLRPTLARFTHGLSRETVAAIEQLLLSEFQAQAHLFLPPSVIPHVADTVSWWTVMQHHGAPTRLLDWTKSAHVAAYFAVVQDDTKPGAVWYFHAARLRERMKVIGAPERPSNVDDFAQLLKSAAEKPYCYLFERKQRTDRMVVQQGGFTLPTDPLADHATLILEALTANDEKEWLRKLIVPPSLKPEFLRRLHRLNVTARALFPGIDGLGRSISEIAQLHAQAARVTA